MSQPYRADIDGLGAVAVMAVVAFHAYPQRVPSGFVGVDIFFVISGFLISGILLDAIARGTMSIGVRQRPFSRRTSRAHSQVTSRRSCRSR